MLAVAVVQCCPAYVRLARAAALGELAREYVVATRSAGAGVVAADAAGSAAQLPRAADRASYAGVFRRDILDAAALGFLGLGRATADAGMGHHAGGRAAILPARLVAADLSWARRSW